VGAAGRAAERRLPLVYVESRRRARRESLRCRLPNAFDSDGQGSPLRGIGDRKALQPHLDTVRENPIAAEFANCQKRQNLGLRAELAFHEMAHATDPRTGFVMATCSRL